jgi:hypothetical protein
LMMIVSMGCDYVSELRPQTGLLFIPKWWAWRITVDIYRQGKASDSSTRVLWQSYKQSRLVAKQEDLPKEIMSFALRSMSFINEIWGYHRHYYNVSVVLGFRAVSENTRCQNSRQHQHYHFHISKGYLTRYKLLYHGADGFTSPPKEGVLRIFVAVKNQSPSDGFEPVNIGPNIKHANHYTT